jgi:gas vesicle protein
LVKRSRRVTKRRSLILSIIGNIIGFLGSLIPMLFAYRAGKKSAQVDVLENESDIIEKSNEIETSISRSSDDNVHKQLRERWSKQK